MIEVDDSELEADDREFLERWANALEVRVEVLVLRILEAAIEGDQFVKMRPRDRFLISVSYSPFSGCNLNRNSR
jgi:hypothetical protein